MLYIVVVAIQETLYSCAAMSRVMVRVSVSDKVTPEKVDHMYVGSGLPPEALHVMTSPISYSV